MLPALALASLALLASGASAAECTRKYTVKAGDYCDTISAANKASTYQLGAINAGVINKDCDNLVPGQEICLANTDADCQEVTVVIAGNTCEAIWSKYNLDKEVFYKNNPQVRRDCRNIYIDEVLCVAKNTDVPAPPPADVPIHTGPPAAEATPPVPLPPLPAGETEDAPNFAAPTPAPAAPQAPAPAAPEAPVTPAPAPAPADDDEEECEEEYEEIEVVEGETDEDLPFCDELD